MKAELELTINANGEPVIKIRHHDRSSELEQKLLGVFCKNAIAHGLSIRNTAGFLEAGTKNSHEDYEIVANRAQS